MAPSRGGKGSSKSSKSTGNPPAKSQRKQKEAQKFSNETPTSSASRPAIAPIPLKVQQWLLDIFVNTFSHLLNPQAAQDTLKPLLQEVKGHLYNRDFAAAFGKEEYLEAYAARWSASRALGYVEIFREVLQHFEVATQPSSLDEEVADLQHGKQNTENARKGAADIKVICLGGGAGAELVALAGNLALHEYQAEFGNLDVADIAAEERTSRVDTEVRQRSDDHLAAALVDIAEWTNVTAALAKAVFEQPKVSPYASAAAKAAAKPLVSSNSAFSSRFIQQDVLESEYDISSLLALPKSTIVTEQLEDNSMPSCNTDHFLITMMFTLNELYATSIAATQHLLIKLTSAVQPGTLLLVVDSPGSYSTVTVNNSEKKYPMLWLLEHTLFNQAPKALNTGEDGGFEPVVWKRVLSDESRWFRLPEGLRYPIELENMRYQIHLYRRL